MIGRTDGRTCTLRKACLLISEEHKKKLIAAAQRGGGQNKSTPSHFLLRQSYPFVLDMKIVSLKEGLEVAKGELLSPPG
jgi:hypothetical protein